MGDVWGHWSPSTPPKDPAPNSIERGSSALLGAVVVALPYMFGSGLAALVAAVALAGLALFGVGATTGLLNGRGGLRSGTRQLLVGGAAALLVFLIGHMASAIAGVRLGAG